MRTCGLAVLALALAPGMAVADSVPDPGGERPTVIVVAGAPGEEEYGRIIAKSAQRWEQVCEEVHANVIVIGLERSGATNDLARLEEVLLEEPKDVPNELWLVLIGHGTFDGKEPKFNLRGPDLSASDLAVWLQPFQRPLAVLAAASSSAPFLNKLSAPGRVIIAATKSGYEHNYARFGEYVSETIADLKADLDKDGQTSLLEAFLTASYRVAEFYKSEGRLATEHALIDDNGDGLGTPAEWFRGVRAIKKAQDGASVDGLRAHQFHLVRSEAERRLTPAFRAKRNELEVEVAKLRDSKENLGEEEYFNRLEALMLELARLYEQSAAPAQ